MLLVWVIQTLEPTVEFLDAAPGIIVFVLFVLNKKTLLALKQRWRNGPNTEDQESVSELDAGITMDRNEAQHT
jgi:hypothetical protein